MKNLVWCLRNTYTFVALKLAWGEARGRECIPSDTRPTEQRSPGPISAQPAGRHVFWSEALLLAPHRSTSGYARRSRLASAQNPLPRMYSYFGDTTLKRLAFGIHKNIRGEIIFLKNSLATTICSATVTVAAQPMGLRSGSLASSFLIVLLNRRVFAKCQTVPFLERSVNISLNQRVN